MRIANLLTKGFDIIQFSIFLSCYNLILHPTKWCLKIYQHCMSKWQVSQSHYNEQQYYQDVQNQHKKYETLLLCLLPNDIHTAHVLLQSLTCHMDITFLELNNKKSCYVLCEHKLDLRCLLFRILKILFWIPISEVSYQYQSETFASSQM